jgi:hypothetical protein
MYASCSFPIPLLLLSIMNSEFYRFLRLCSSKVFFSSQMVSPIVLKKNKGHPLLSERGPEICSIKDIYIFGISVLRVFQMILYRVL